ncbi:hypothetical protein JVT61DRAFT_3735 [Boletus reticuloceps]|uniref:Uncharacterized protein n=1 Tax=Boletus reticuloceps TaxID=495285 RepID=A0A8I2YNE9_9AGAM|nr:hypothetical protein JVT61DRAFT_3735 [Boletus reticuloceps]
MSGALSKLLMLAVPDPNTAKKEAVLTAYKNAASHLVNLVKCAPDNKSDLMDEQGAWVVQWEKVDGLLSMSLAIAKAGLVLPLKEDMCQAVREGERWAKLWKVCIELADMLEVAVNTTKEMEEFQAEAGPSQPEAEASCAEMGALQLEGELASTTVTMMATIMMLEKEKDRRKGTKKETPRATPSKSKSRSLKRQDLIIKVVVPLHKRVKCVEEEEPIERQDESEDEEEDEVKERHAFQCKSCTRKKLPCVGRPFLVCRACAGSCIKCSMSAGKGKVKTKAKPSIKVTPVQCPVRNKPHCQASLEVLTILEDEEGGCKMVPKTGKSKAKASGSSGSDAKAAVGKAISMLMDLQERGLGLRKK